MLVTSSIAVWVSILTFGDSLANTDKLLPGKKASNPTGSAMAYSVSKAAGTVLFCHQLLKPVLTRLYRAPPDALSCE